MTHAELINVGTDDLHQKVTAMQRAEMSAGAFLAGFTSKETQRGYRSDLRDFLQYLITTFGEDIDPIHDVRRGHIDTYLRQLEERGMAAGTVVRRLAVARSWYRYLLAEEWIDRDPTINVRRPRIARESTRDTLGRLELADFLAAGEREGGYPYALVCLLGINGLRIGEACGADISDLGKDRYHHTLSIVGKGNQPAVVALPPRVIDAIKTAIGHRTEGPLILNQYGLRMNREAAGRICRRLALAARIAKNITPHSLRHAAVTAYLNATDGDITGARDFARHVDISTTMIYDRRRKKLDASGSYVVAAFSAGGD